MPPLTMIPPLDREAKYIIVILILGAMVMAAGHRIMVLSEKPSVLDVEIDNRTEDYRRGPVKRTTKTTYGADGKKATVEKVEEIASEEKTLESSRSSTHNEVPAKRDPTRYIGLALDPLDYRRPRFRGGLSLWNTVDAGLAYDSRFQPLGGALQIEVAYRF